ncbi:hypothetical protein [Nostoc sp.]|uniref:hypothetical protein n=1 Tax=Nostoc sp. TaxID=1180 RepID=UPI002FFB852C
MAGGFVREAFRTKGLSDREWKLFEDMFSKQPEKRGKGMPDVPYRKDIAAAIAMILLN